MKSIDVCSTDVHPAMPHDERGHAVRRLLPPGRMTVLRVVRSLAAAVILTGGVESAHASLVGDQVTVGIFVQSGVGTIVGSPTATVGPGDEFVVTQTVGPSLLVTHTIDVTEGGLNIQTTSTGSGGGSSSIRFTFTSLDTGGSITGFQKTAGLNQINNPSHTADSIAFDLSFFTSAVEPRTTTIEIQSSQPVAFRLQGTVVFVDNSDGLLTELLGSSPAVGDIVTSTYSFDPATPDVLPSDTTYGLYRGAFRTASMSVSGTPVPLSIHTTQQFIVNDNRLIGTTTSRDQYTANPGPTTLGDLVIRPILAELLQDGPTTAPPTALTSDSLPVSPPDVSLFSQQKVITLQVERGSAVDRLTAQIAFIAVVGADTDEDGVADIDDNCPSIANADQTDSDHDGAGDACDTDDDNDGVVDGGDNCPMVANAGQADADGDGLGNACDGDLDGDGFDNAVDNCPAAGNTDQTDTDHDGLGDECDTDDDNDGLADSSDNCTAVPNSGQDDLDGDGIGDTCDVDLDGDGTTNDPDNCPIDANVGQDDTDGDGQGDSCDSDADNDTVANGTDNCSLVANLSQTDSDGDGQGDACDADLDGDGVTNGADNCATVANSGQTDFDGDGQGDVCDNDADDDGVGNGSDQCAATLAGATVDPASGCSIVQLCPCEGPRGTILPWRNHGKYVSCVAHSAEEMTTQGLISNAQKGAIVSAAGQAACGK